MATDGINRFLEIDTLRGIGIIMMLIFHFFFDLDYFGILKNGMYEGLWLVFQRITATLLILIVGISLVLSYQKTQKSQNVSLFVKFLKRALSLAAIAGLITLVTWVYPHDGFIVFGIIHFIALSVILGYFFLRFFYFNLVLGAAIIAIGLKMSEVTVSTNTLFWLGLTFPGFYTLDYVPLFPWFGVVLIGISLGKYLYPGNRRRAGLPFPNLSLTNPITNAINFFGRNALVIYLTHQLVIIGMIWVFLRVK